MSRGVSVIMPSRNAGQYIDAALRSIARQAVPAVQVIIADAGSTDETAAIVARYEGRADLSFSFLPLGRDVVPSVARNHALEGATGEFVAFLDADDLWPAGKLARQLARLDASPELGMVSGYVRYFEAADDTGLAPAPGSRTTDLVHVHLGACVYRATTLQRLGGFDPELRFAEDMDLLMRVRESGTRFCIPRSVELYYRRHPAAMTAVSDPRQEADFRRATLNSLQRRRRAGTASLPLPDLASFVVD